MAQSQDWDSLAKPPSNEDWDSLATATIPKRTDPNRGKFSRKVEKPGSIEANLSAFLAGMSGSVEAGVGMISEVARKGRELTGLPKIPGVTAPLTDMREPLSRAEQDAGFGLDRNRNAELKIMGGSVPEGFGSSIGALLFAAPLAPVGPALGLGGIASAALPGAASGSLVTSGSMYQDTLAKTGDEGKAWEAAGWGALIGTTEAADTLILGGIGKGATRPAKEALLRSIRQKIGAAAKEVAIGAGGEALQEGTQNTLQAVVDRKLTGEERDLFMEFLSGAAMGGVLGGVFGGASAARDFRGGKAPSTEAEAPSQSPEDPSSAQPEGELVARPGDANYVPPEPEDPRYAKIRELGRVVSEIGEIEAKYRGTRMPLEAIQELMRLREKRQALALEAAPSVREEEVQPKAVEPEPSKPAPNMPPIIPEPTPAPERPKAPLVEPIPGEAQTIELPNPKGEMVRIEPDDQTRAVAKAWGSWGAKTGTPGRFVAYHGSGREAGKSVLAEGVTENILGDAFYGASSPEHAERYGPNVERVEIELRNPFVVDSAQQLGALGFERNNAARAPLAKQFRERLIRGGYDGVIVNVAWDRDDGGQKVLRETFGEPQVIAFDRNAVHREAKPEPLEELTVNKNLVAEQARHEGFQVEERLNPTATTQREYTPPEPLSVKIKRDAATKDLQTFTRSVGGIRGDTPEGRELYTGLAEKEVGRAFGLGPIVRSPKSRHPGVNWEQVKEKAFEAGFFPEHARSADITYQDFADALTSNRMHPERTQRFAQAEERAEDQREEDRYAFYAEQDPEAAAEYERQKREFQADLGKISSPVIRMGGPEEGDATFDPSEWETDLKDATEEVLTVRGDEDAAPKAEHYVRAVKGVSDAMGKPPGPPVPPAPPESIPAPMENPQDPAGMGTIETWRAERDLAHADANHKAGMRRKAIESTLKHSLGRFLRERFDPRLRRQRAQVEEAMHYAIDLKGKLDEEYAKYGQNLPEQDKAILERAKNLTPAQRAIVEEIIRDNRNLSQIAKDADVIKTIIEEYTKRLWSPEFGKFKTSTKGALGRIYSSILQGRSEGRELLIRSAVDAANWNEKVIADIILNRNLVQKGIKDGWLVSKTPPEGWKAIEHRSFRDQDGLQLFAPPAEAIAINNVLGRSAITEFAEQGSKAGKAVGLADKSVVIAKTMATAGVQDNIVYMALSNFGAQPGLKGAASSLAVLPPYLRGKKLIEAWGPDLRELVRTGGLSFSFPDIQQYLDLQQGRLSKKLDEMKIAGAPARFIKNGYRDMQTFLYGKFIPAYKANLAILELMRLRKVFRKELLSGEMTDAQLMKAAAQLSNNVFSGQNWQRGIESRFAPSNPTAMHAAQLAFFAPDRMTSNLRVAADAFRAGATGAAHRALWGRMASRYLFLWAASNLAMAAMADDDEGFAKRTQQNFRLGFREGFGVDVSPLLKKFGRKNPSRLFVGLNAQKFEGLELAYDFTQHLGLGYLRRKLGILPSMGIDAATGEDYKGRRFTTTDELFGTDDEKGYYQRSKPGFYDRGDPKGGRLAGQFSSYSSDADPGVLSVEQLPSFLGAHAPIPFELRAWLESLQGQTDAWDAALQTGGLRTIAPSPKRQEAAGIGKPTGDYDTLFQEAYGR